jgi:hypothetical protein
MRISTVPVAILAPGAASLVAAAETYRLEKTHVDPLFSIDHAVIIGDDVSLTIDAEFNRVP